MVDNHNGLHMDSYALLQSSRVIMISLSMHRSTIRSFAEKSFPIIRPMVDRIFASRRPARLLRPFLGLIWPVDPKYGMRSREEVSQHSSIGTVFLGAQTVSCFYVSMSRPHNHLCRRSWR